MTGSLDRAGYLHLPADPATAAWAAAARTAALAVLATPGDMRHGGTWRVGVDELPNATDGSVAGVALGGAWVDHIDPPGHWHRAQLSVVYPGYPRQDPDESDTNHHFRLHRDAAHVDGLLPEGPDKRRHLREPHAFVLGLPLNDATGSPLVVWPGSHRIMQAAFRQALHGIPADHWAEVDLTDPYTLARRQVFDTCARVELPARPGEATLLHRHLLHGVAPWGDGTAPPEGRIIAYFRPMVVSIADWL